MVPGVDKWLNTTPPVALVNNASALTTTIDTLGYDWCTIVVQFGVIGAAATALKVQESDLANMGSAADVTGLVFGTSNNIAGTASALPASTADNNLYIFDIDLRARKRYLDLVTTMGVGDCYVTSVTRLSRAENALATAAGRGAADVLSA